MTYPSATSQPSPSTSSFSSENAHSREMQQSEGTVARRIEEQTARLPSDTFLWAALGSIAASATLQAIGQKHGSLFVGQWAPVFLMFGIYNKLVKQLGSDRLSRSVA